MGTRGATCQAENWRGLPAWRVVLPGGDSVLVAEQGAQVLSWCSGGRERLFLSPASAADGRTPIRGGVPVCWPQFNQRGPLPKHGFARQFTWQRGAFDGTPSGAELRWHLQTQAATLAVWPHVFELTLSVRLALGSLRIALEVHNPGSVDWSFSGALHTYLAVDEVTQARLQGLAGQAEWDSLRDARGQGLPALQIDGPFDRVYTAAAEPLSLIDGGAQLRISQSRDWGHTVVWNPGSALPDMPDAGFRRMLCVEAAQVWEPITVAAGARWQGWQQFDVLCG